MWHTICVGNEYFCWRNLQMGQKNRTRAVFCREVVTGRVAVFNSFTEAGEALGVSNQLLSRAAKSKSLAVKKYAVSTGLRFYVVKCADRSFRLCTYNADGNRYEEVGGYGNWSENSVLGAKDVTICMKNEGEVNLQI